VKEKEESFLEYSFFEMESSELIDLLINYLADMCGTPQGYYTVPGERLI
jgi:hypothetical protein